MAVTVKVQLGNSQRSPQRRCNRPSIWLTNSYRQRRGKPVTAPSLVLEQMVLPGTARVFARGCILGVSFGVVWVSVCPARLRLGGSSSAGFGHGAPTDHAIWVFGSSGTDQQRLRNLSSYSTPPRRLGRRRSASPMIRRTISPACGMSWISALASPAITPAMSKSPRSRAVV